MRTEGCTQREIKKILNDRFGLILLQNEINHIVAKIPNQNKKYSEIEIKKILYLYHHFHDTYKLAEYLNKKYNYNFTYRRLIDLASKNGVCKKAQNMYSISKISRQDEFEIIKLYSRGYSSNEIAKIFGYKTRNSILQKLEKFDVKRRGCNEQRCAEKSYSAFSLKKIDSVEKAYLLGLLITDGFINEERGYVGLELTDLDAIEFFSDFINIRYTSIEPVGKAKLVKYRVIIYSRELLNDVRRLGVIYQKTYFTKGPLLDDDEINFTSCIIRGIIDGDGWIRKDGKEFFISSASFEFINWCRSALIMMGFTDIHVNFIKNNYNGIYLIRTASEYNLNLLKNIVYYTPLGMMRKYNRLHQIDVQRL